MGQGKSQFTEDELQDYQVVVQTKHLNVKNINLFNNFIGSHLFYQKGSIIVCTFVVKQ